jgi:SAM-dependent methyltransferase
VQHAVASADDRRFVSAGRSTRLRDGFLDRQLVSGRGCQWAVAMSLQYRLLYRIGFTPWEQMADLPVKEQLVSLFEREERERGGAGTALDLGCGTGIWAVELARRGWNVTGVDVVPKAVEAARRRAKDEAGSTTFLQGDVARVDSLGLGQFDLLLDVSCFHELDDERRASMGRAVDAVATAEATMLLQAFAPRGRNPTLPRGATADQIAAAFQGWEIVDDVVADVTGAPKVVKNARPRFFRLVRRGG